MARRRISRRVRDGLRVVVFEQTAEVLEKRFGFRVAEYGLRWVFPRVPDHPLLAGLRHRSISATGADRRRFCRRNSSMKCVPGTARQFGGATSRFRDSGGAAIAATWHRC